MFVINPVANAAQPKKRRSIMKEILKDGTVYHAISRKMIFDMVKNWTRRSGDPKIVRQEIIDGRVYTKEYCVAAAIGSLWSVYAATFSYDFETFSDYFKKYHVLFADDFSKNVGNVILIKSKNDTVIVPYDSCPDLYFYKDLEAWKRNEVAKYWDSHCLGDRDMRRYV